VGSIFLILELIGYISGSFWFLRGCEGLLQEADDLVDIIYPMKKATKLQLLALYNKRGSILEVIERRSDDRVSHTPAGCTSTQSSAPSKNMSTE